MVKDWKHWRKLKFKYIVDGHPAPQCYIYCEHTVKVLTDALTVKDREIIEHKKSYAERDLSRVFFTEKHCRNLWLLLIYFPISEKTVKRQ